MKRYSSLRRKLTALIAGGGIVTALIAAAGFSWLEVQRSRESTNAEVFAISSIVADQVEPAIALGDRKAATEILNSLRADRSIRDAVLYNARGVCFARMNSPSDPCPPLPPDGLHPQQDAVVLARAIQADGGGGSGGGSAIAGVGAHSGDRRSSGADLPNAPVPGPGGGDRKSKRLNS